MELIGLSGYARSGKDEAAKILVEEYDFTRVAFADKLRDFLYALNPIISQDVRVCSEILKEGWEPFVTTIRLRDVINHTGWDGYKETKVNPEIRGLLQRLGTEAGRETLWDNIWVDATLNNLDPYGRYVITDARFENEALAVKDEGGEVWRVTRDGVGPVNDHPSETGLDNWSFDAILKNNSTLEAYHNEVRRTYESRI